MAIIGKQAVVIGAGIGGLAAAGALSDYFERVTVLERDHLPDTPTPRSGAAQSRHTHGLLIGGQRALEELFPGFVADLLAAGAVQCSHGFDSRLDRPGFDPYPQRDFGLNLYWASRPLIELTIRNRLGRMANVGIETNSRVEGLVGSPDGRQIVGVRYVDADGNDELITADLVIDASGRAAPTLDFLRASRRTMPDESMIGIDVTYATAIASVPDDAPSDWKYVGVFPESPEGRTAGLVCPIEGDRWIVTLAGILGVRPPADEEGFRGFAQSLRTPTISNALRHAKLLTPIARFGFPDSIRRHWERLTDFPEGVLPLGDSACRFNPVYGQGMSVAAMEAGLLRRVLEEAARADNPLGRVRDVYLERLAPLLDPPWGAISLFDLAYPQTRGVRPPDLADRLRFGAALIVLAARDPDVHKLTLEVQHLIAPPNPYGNPDLQARVRAVMAEMAPPQ